MKILFTIFFLVLSFQLYSQAINLGNARNAAAPAIINESTQISVLTKMGYCRIIPTDNAVYTIRSIGSSDGGCQLFNSSGNLLAAGDDEAAPDFVINQNLTANNIYYLGIIDYNTANSFTLSITGGGLALPLGSNMDNTAPLIIQSSTNIFVLTSLKYCKIIPGNSSVYTISSIGSSDGGCILYDEAYNPLVEGDDENGTQFEFSYSLTAGQTYYLGIIDYNQANSFTLSIVGGALPIELTSFESSIIGNKVLLNWKTSTEVNNYRFEIERRLPQSLPKEGAFKTPLPLGKGQGDGLWETLGFVAGAGNSNSPKEYSFVDENPVIGNLQYRLKQVDNDGKFSFYPKFTEVNFSPTGVKEKYLPTEYNLSQNYPNPFNPMTSIGFEIANSGFVTLKVYNILGNEVAALVNENKTPGYYKVQFNGRNLPSGVYIYKLTAGKFSSTKKLVLMK